MTFWACFGGWALDALDLQMFSQAIPALITTWGISKAEAGFAGGISLFSLSLGGWLGGWGGDRWGRVRMLQITILWFSAFTLLTAVAQNFEQLLVFKALQGLGFGGEWAVGAALMAEVLPTAVRGRALGLVQSAWAVGWGAAVLLYTLIFLYFEPQIAWRILFGIGVLPAFLVLYVRRHIPEPPRIARKEESALGASPFVIFTKPLLMTTLIGAAFGVGARGGYYALMTWLPAYLQSERHLSISNASGFLAVIIVAFWCGCAVCAFLMDKLGRRNAVVAFSLCCLITVFVYMYAPLSNSSMLILGFPLGFFAAGVPASMGAWFSELYPQYARGAGVGFCYCFGGIVASFFPALVGKMTEHMSLGIAMASITCVCYAVVLVSALLLRETSQQNLDTATAGAGEQH
ncbi:MFS transporter [Bordetella sp. N]|uniref:MFS transporter n=1 Tax=Bordetella sp. N TaxID=1746199 RepID=UPI001E4F82FC|nr:MFS transporter [Bordetella sp. N]